MYLTHQKLSIHQTDSNENYYAFLSKQNEFSNCAKYLSYVSGDDPILIIIAFIKHMT